MSAIELLPGAPPDGAPQGDALHIRLIDLRQAASIETRLRCFLSPDEITRASRIHLERARSRFVVTRGWLRVILARCLRAAPEEIVFAYGTNGKPTLGGSHRENELSFNLSHSGDYALIGLTTRGPIGVDIEQVRAMPDFESMTSQYFSAPEARAVMACPEPDRLRAFFRCWTRKEAFMKATGEGMGIALDAFSVALDDDAETRISKHGQWTVRGLSLVPECEAAVAVARRVGAILAWRDPVDRLFSAARPA